MSSLIRITNPDGSFTFKDSKTGEIVNPNQNNSNSSLSGWLSALGIVYFIASFIIAILFFVNSTATVSTMFGEIRETNEFAIALGITALFNGIIIMLISLALSKLLDSASRMDSNLIDEE